MLRAANFDQIPVARHDLSDMRQEFDRGHQIVDRRLQRGRNRRPGFPQQAARPLIDAEIRDPGLKSLAESGFAHDGATLLGSSVTAGGIERVDIRTGAELPPLDHSSAIAGGFVPGRSLFWSVSVMDGVRLFDTRTWSPVLPPA